MKRRDFVKNIAIASAGTPILLNNIKMQSLGKKLFDVPKSAEDRVLVIIRLNGGNDGLNTVIPRDQYSNLSVQRNNILIPETSVLPLTAEVGLHPVMTGMQGIYNDGKLSVIQNVGYPEQNRSHFRSMDIWTSGLIDNDPTTGWLGRYFQDYNPNYPDGYPNSTYPDPFAISMGYEVSTTCQGILANFSHAVSNPFDNYNLLTSGAVNDGTYYGDQVEYLANLIDQANGYGAEINAAANAGNTLATYPSTTLGQQLQYVAQMISGGLKTKVYILNVGGFDTHDAQVTSTDTTTGTHANLLQTVSDAVAAFQNDLQLLGIENRVAGMTFSEFGRQVASNGSRGTDHGDAAPLFLFGTCIEGGIVGANPTIGSTVVDQAGVPMEFDFRDIYASILKDWFGVDTTTIQSFFEHTVTYYNVLGACNLGVEEKSLAKDEAILYPNPCSNSSTIRFKSDDEWVRIDIFDFSGRDVGTICDSNLTPGSHDIFFETRDFQQGEYVVQILKKSGNVQTKLIKVR